MKFKLLLGISLSIFPLIACEKPEQFSFDIATLKNTKNETQMALHALFNNVYLPENICKAWEKCYRLRHQLQVAQKANFNSFTLPIKTELRSWEFFSLNTPPAVDSILLIYKQMLKRYADKAADSRILNNKRCRSSSDAISPIPAIPQKYYSSSDSISTASETSNEEIENIRRETELALITCRNLESIKQAVGDIQTLINQIPEAQKPLSGK